MRKPFLCRIGIHWRTFSGYWFIAIPFRVCKDCGQDLRIC